MREFVSDLNLSKRDSDRQEGKPLIYHGGATFFIRKLKE